MCWHKWGKWKPTEIIRVKVIQGKGYDDVIQTQEKKCKKCGYTVIEEVYK